jgi:hypothetical protein
MKILKQLSLVWFIKNSLNFMQGYSKLYIWSHMFPSYIRFCYYTMRGVR